MRNPNMMAKFWRANILRFLPSESCPSLADISVASSSCQLNHNVKKTWVAWSYILICIYAADLFKTWFSILQQLRSEAQNELISQNSFGTIMPRSNQQTSTFKTMCRVAGKFISLPFCLQNCVNFYFPANFLVKILTASRHITKIYTQLTFFGLWFEIRVTPSVGRRWGLWETILKQSNQIKPACKCNPRKIPRFRLRVRFMTVNTLTFPCQQDIGWGTDISKNRPVACPCALIGFLILIRLQVTSCGGEK